MKEFKLFSLRKNGAPLPKKQKTAPEIITPEAVDFHSWRMKGIGGSDAPAVMGASPWTSPLALWEIKTRRRQPEPLNYPMRRGLALEPIAREVYVAQTGMEVEKNQRDVHPEYDFVRGNFDGINYDKRQVLEIKCPGRVDHEVAVQGKIPDKYLWQCVHLLLVTGFNALDYFSFDGKTGVLVPFERDKLLEEKLLENETKFWQHVVRDVPPGKTLKTKKEKIVVDNQKNVKSEVSPKDLVDFLDHARKMGVTSLTLNLNGATKAYDIPKNQEELPYCEYHKADYVLGQYGSYCKECYIDKKERNKRR